MSGSTLTGTALRCIALERNRQQEFEGFTTEYDDRYTAGELAMAAATYAMPHEHRMALSHEKTEEMGWPPETWPWDEPFWKPTPDDRVRELVKAGALIVAEIERLLRAKRVGGAA